MKKKFRVAVLCSAAMLLTGALAVSMVDKLWIKPRTVSSWGELVDCYLVARTSLPPLPFAYDDAFAKMEAGDWSFLVDHWQYKQTDGSYYVAKDSELAKLPLPLHIRIYEDLQRGDVIVLSSTDGTNFQGEVLFKAPEFMPYEKDFPVDRYAMDELWPRCVVWEITLKPEADAWSDLVTEQSTLTASSLSLDGGMMMMSVPAEHTNDIWLALETQANGINLNVFAPEWFTNRVEIYSCADLVSNVWTVAVQNLYPSTNPAVWDATSTLTNRFLRAGNMDIDSDHDGVPDAREMYVYKTDPDVSNLSPAIGNGTDLGSVDAIDIDNNRRAGAWTIGAYQVNVSTSTVDTLAPVIYLVEPFEGTVVSHGTLPVSAAAKDNIGVAGVQFRLNGSNLGDEVTTPPFSNVWNAAAATNGSYELTAVARDADGNTATSAVVSVIVNTNATDYYVSSVNTNASDSNPGTDPNYPWAAMGKVYSEWGSLSAGDTVHLERGSTFSFSYVGGSHDLTHGGSSSGGSITLRGDDYGAGANPKLVRTGGDEGGEFFSIQNSYITIRDIDLDNDNKGGTGIYIGSWGARSMSHVNILNVGVYNCASSNGYRCGIWVQQQSGDTVSDVLIEGCVVSNYTASGINIYGPGRMDNITVRNNRIFNTYTAQRWEAACGIQILGRQGSGNVYENNYVHDSTLHLGTLVGAQIYLGGKYHDWDGTVVVRHNIVDGTDQDTHGISIYTSEFAPGYGSNFRIKAQIIGNIIYNCGGPGIDIVPWNTYSAGTTVEIFNNTLYNNCTSGDSFGFGHADSSVFIHQQCQNMTVTLSNNLVYHNPYGSSVPLSFSLDGSFDGIFDHDNNLYYNSAGVAAKLVDVTGTNDYTAANITNWESTAQTGDPFLMNINQLPAETTLSGGISPDGLAVQPWP